MNCSMNCSGNRPEIEGSFTMMVHNHLPLLIECLRRWEKPPSLEEFLVQYYSPLSTQLDVIFDGDGAGFHASLADLQWPLYRADALRIDPAAEERRLRGHIASIEKIFGAPLGGEAVLWGAFTLMDGYARFEGGRHCVFLGVDESHHLGRYLDVLEVHELTHVVRESQASVWAGFGLDPKMSHDQFSENLPVIEHLMNEGFSCAVSEMLVPGADPWHYAYQTETGLARALEHGPRLDREVRAELRAADGGDWSRLYDSSRYGAGMPPYAHYLWAWQWAKSVIGRFGGGDPRQVVGTCSREWLADALAFQLPSQV
jgi:hypothetical protein